MEGGVQTAAVLPPPKGKQREVLVLKTAGHTVVLGTAGSGKTTMAIHRAAYLGDARTSHAGKVLLCTFNRSLIAYLKYWQPSALSDVVFQNYHKFALGYLNSQGKMGRNDVCDDDRRLAYISQAAENVRAQGKPEDLAALAALSDGFIADEIRYIDRYGLDLSEYVRLERAGRGVGFLRAHRPAIWLVRAEYHRLRSLDGFQYDWFDVGAAVLREFEQDDTQRMYRHIIVDEGQNFSPVMLRSLAAAIAEDGSLTFFGDMAQQLYGRHVSWRQAGLNIPPGEAVVQFKRNYRNTPEIATLGLAIAAMPYFNDVPDMVTPDEFEGSGPKPSLIAFPDRTHEAKFVIE